MFSEDDTLGERPFAQKDPGLTPDPPGTAPAATPPCALWHLARFDFLLLVTMAILSDAEPSFPPQLIAGP